MLQKICNSRVVKVNVIGDIDHFFGSCQIYEEVTIREEKKYFIDYCDGTHEIYFVVKSKDKDAAVRLCEEEIRLYIEECLLLEEEEEE